MISLFQFSEARDIGPFTFKLDKPEGDWIEHSDLTMIEYYGVIQKGSTINLPLHILPTFNEPTQLEFHSTIGDQMGPPKLPRGIHVKIEPESFTLNPNQEKTINIEVTADKNTPSNVYSIGIIGVWPEPINNFMGTSIKVHVGRDFGPSAVPDNFYPPPLKQTSEGLLPTEVMCTNDYVLILKTSMETPACVKPTSMLRLLENGWGYIPRTFETNTDLLNTTVTGGKIVGFKFDVEAASILMHIQTTDNGTCTVTIPKVLTNVMSWYELNPSHGVLVDGYMVTFEEINSAKGTTITFPFTNAAKLIEIVGTR